MHRARAGTARGSVLVIWGRLTADDVAPLCARGALLVRAHPGAPLVCDVSGVENADAVVVEALARLHLTARRLGCRVRVRGASRELRDLLALVGLAELR